MAEGSLVVAAAVELVFAAVAMQLGGVFLLWWWLRREDRYLVWLAAWSFTAFLTLVLQSLIFALPTGSGAVDVLVAGRTLPLGGLTALVVPPVCLLAGRRVAWWLVSAITAVYLARWALTLGTDVIWAGEYDDYGLPSYTPLRALFMFTPLATLLLLLPTVSRIPDPMQRRALHVAFAAAVLPVPVAAVMDDPVVRELATGAWSLPIILALALIGLRRVLDDEAARRRLVGRQRSLLRLGNVEGEELTAAAEQDLLEALGRRVVLMVSHDESGDAPSSAPADPATCGLAVRVQGHRSTATAQLRGNGEPLTVEDEGFVRAVLRIVVSAADRATAEQELVQAALYDVLTGLPNRVLLTDRLEHALDRLDRHGGLVAVLFCDLDEFKPVNDTHGHATGDLLLREVAAALRSVARSSDTVARFGGDEFVVVAEDLGDREDAVRVADRMTAAVGSLENPVTGRPVRMSVGLVCAGPGEASATRLLRAADQAMYQAKAGVTRSGPADIGRVVLGELTP